MSSQPVQQFIPSSLRYGAPPPPMPAYVQAAFFANKYENRMPHGEYTYIQSASTPQPPAPTPALPAVCTAPAPERPPLVQWAVDEAKKSAKAAKAKLPPGLPAGSSSSILTSWEQEAELLRSMHLVSGGVSSTAPTASASAHPVLPSTSLSYGLHSPSLAPKSAETAHAHLMSSPEPRISDVQKIVTDLDKLFSKK